MGLFARIFGRRREARDAGPGIGFDLGWWGSPGIERRPANAILAENLASVTSAVSLISGTVASLPATVFRTVEGTRVEQPAHPVSRLIAQGPNDHQSWPDWLEMEVSEILRYGNSLSVIQSDGRGAVTGLVPIPWPCVRPVLLDANRDAPRMAFDIIASWGWFVAMPGLMKRYLDSEVLLIRDRSDDGFIGRSRIARSAEVIADGLGLQRHSVAMWENGTSPSGVLTHPKTLGDPARKRLKDQMEEFRGAQNAGRSLLLEEGTDWKSIAVSPADAEVLASRKFSVVEVARLFGIPPLLIGDWAETRLANAAIADVLFARYCLAPIVKKVEAAFVRSIFTDPALSLDIDLSGLLRGDFKTRWDAWIAAVGGQVLTPNEARAMEDFPPIEGGDVLRSVPGSKPLPDNDEPVSTDAAA